MALDTLPIAPDPNDRATFDARAYPLNVALQTMVEQINSEVIPLANDAVVSSSAAVASANYKGLWSSLTGALAIPASVFHASKVWMLTESVADVTAQVPGVSSKWISLTASAPSLTRSARTSNTALVTADQGKLIDITSGTFTQTFSAATTLGDGWWCYLRNSGTGDITLDPNASETIDGVATKVLYPGQTVIVQCDGTALRTVTVSGVGNHYVTVNTGNGHGSTNSRIRRFTTTFGNAGTAITYADSATLGAAFTINEPGLYAFTYEDHHDGAQCRIGVTLNSTSLSSDVYAFANNAFLLGQVASAGASVPASVTGVTRLNVGDVVRPHTGTTLPNGTTAETRFTIRKVGL